MARPALPATAVALVAYAPQKPPVSPLHIRPSAKFLKHQTTKNLAHKLQKSSKFAFSDAPNAPSHKPKPLPATPIRPMEICVPPPSPESPEKVAAVQARSANKRLSEDSADESSTFAKAAKWSPGSSPASSTNVLEGDSDFSVWFAASERTGD